MKLIDIIKRRKEKDWDLKERDEWMKHNNELIIDFAVVEVEADE